MASSRIAQSSSILSPIRAVLFDLDHTLFDTDRAERIALKTALRAIGLAYSTATLDTYREINQDLWKAYQRGEISPPALARERFCRLLQHLGHTPRHAAALAMRYMDALASRGDLHPGCKATLRRLARHCLLATVTNGVERVQRSRLRAARIEAFFDSVVTSEGCGFTKPDPRIVHCALESLGVAPQEALLVGDDPHTDGRAAQRAGVRFCWYDDGKPLGKGLRPPRLRITQLSEVVGLLNGPGGGVS